MSSVLAVRLGVAGVCLGLLAGCGPLPWNNPYPAEDSGKPILYQAFASPPKHLDPAVAYSANEYEFIGQIYEPPLQYHYLRRPYQLVPLTAASLPQVVYLDRHGRPLADGAGQKAVFTEYVVTLRPGLRYQPHPALAKTADGGYRYHRLTLAQAAAHTRLADFADHGSRELVAEDYVYQIKRLAHPKNLSPIAGLMADHIVGFADFARAVAELPKTAIREVPMAGVRAQGRHQYRIRLHGRYPQFMYWLAMPFFAPMPWEADVFYQQPGLERHNISLDSYPVGTGAYLLAENSPNRRIVLDKNPNFHGERYPSEGEAADAGAGLLNDAGRPLPFIDRAVFTLEKETIPYWNKFLQGYYDTSGIASDHFDQAIHLTGAGEMALTGQMRAKDLQLKTSVALSSVYLGFNMLDPVVGGLGGPALKLRQAIAIAVDMEEYIDIFLNGRGVAAQGVLPPGIFGHAQGEAGINTQVYEWRDGQARRKPIAEARRLMAKAGYADGIDPGTGQPLVLYLDTTASGVEERPRMNWYRKQLAKLGVELVVRATDHNRFQEKLRVGNAQLFIWGWNADYPDPENFLFLLYGGHSKVHTGGENAVNYRNPEFDRLFEQMRHMDNDGQRLRIIDRMQALARHDTPWLFGYHPINFTLHHGWKHNFKPHLMANNTIKYARIDAALRAGQRKRWNEPLLWPVWALAAAVLAALATARLRKAAANRPPPARSANGD